MNTAEILVIGGDLPLRKLLTAGGYAVVPEDTAGCNPQLVVLHLGSSTVDRYGPLKELRDVYRKPVIVISALDKETDIIEALDSGASDYLVKPFHSGELLARIRAVLRNAAQSVAEGEPVIRSRGLEIDLSARTVKKDNQWLKLTATQYALLVLFGKNAGRVLTHQYLLHEIWGSDYTGQVQYLRVFVGQLRKKIERDANSPEHIVTESGVGYRFAAEA
jgi:two-component system, OmpR family, KDP operon response regulator KdpE